MIMRKKILKTSILLTLAITWMLAFSLPILADKPTSNGKHGNSSKDYTKDKSKQKGKGDSYSYDKNSDVSILNVYFNDQQRNVISEYYRAEYHSGHCPPGLAKKNNGCMPPGQAKKWRRGYPLPHDVVYYDLPSTVVKQLGRPPEGHRYIRVASDILLIAVGTGMIVDAIQDLNNM
jgi:Ni/Co efflux regulator RcnB